jgi:hypothetical protein
MIEPNYIRAEAKSFALLNRYGIETPNFDIRDIAYELGIDVIVGGVSAGDARIVRLENGRGVIRLNRTITDPFRQRFSIAHEVGHWEIHPNIKQGYLCSAADLRDYGRSPEEAEANWFAATLLMPKFLIPPAAFKQDPTFEFINQLSTDFGTSKTAAARRFVELSSQPVVLVASSQGRVVWTALSNSAKAKFYFLKGGFPLPTHSLSGEVVASRVGGQRADTISPSTWFPNHHFEGEAELFEEVRYSAEYDGALTLLWIPN